MRYLKRILVASLLSLLVTTSYSQQESHDYFFEEVGWTITLPYDFSLLDLNDYSIDMRGENQPMEEENEMATDIISTQTMFIAIKDRFNHFNVVITPFDPHEDGSWEKANQLLKDNTYKTMMKITGSEKLDTTSSIEYIDGLPFQKFHISVIINKDVTVDMFLLSGLYKGYDFSMTCLSINDETKKQIELMLRSSRFN
jgi:hypothetical protein